MLGLFVDMTPIVRRKMLSTLSLPFLCSVAAYSFIPPDRSLHPSVVIEVYLTIITFSSRSKRFCINLVGIVRLAKLDIQPDHQWLTN